MATFQEKTTEKSFYTIEKTIQDTIRNENIKIILHDYADYLLDELKIQKENERILQENLDKLKSIEDSVLGNKYLKLQEKVNECKKYLEQLKDEMENVTIETIADKETLKIEHAEKEQRIISYYKTEAEKLIKQLENSKKEHKKTEHEIKNQITLELSTENARLGEIRANLQRQFVEKNSILIKTQNENKELRKELNILKTQEKLGPNKRKNINSRSNVMEFQNDYLVQKNQTNNPYTYIDVRPPRVTSVISEYSTTEPENQDYNNFINNYMDRPNNACNNSKQNDAAINIIQYYNPFKPVTSSDANENKTSENSVKEHELTNQEVAYFAAEYDQFDKTFTKVFPENSKNAKILDLVPNPCSFVSQTGDNSLTANKINNSQTTNKKITIETAKLPTEKSFISSKHNDLLLIEDPGLHLIKNSDTFNYDLKLPDVPKIEPTIYMSAIKKRKAYSKIDGSVYEKKYDQNGTTLNNISQLTANKWK